MFRNASGLPNPEQVTTARDMARLANALLRDFPHYYPVFSVLTYNYRGRPLENHNRMLASYAGADGLKTGYTNASGFNLVMSAVRDNRRLIGVVMGGNTAFQRDKLMADLMDQGFATAQQMSVSAWTSPRVPPSARYTAASFVPGIGSLDGKALAGFTKAEPAAPSRTLVNPASPPTSLAGFTKEQLYSTASYQAKNLAGIGLYSNGLSGWDFSGQNLAKGDPGRLIQRFAGRPGGAGARDRRPARGDPRPRRSDGRRGAGVGQDAASRAAHQPVPAGSRRRLQAAQPAQDPVLGAADQRALSAGLTRARNARL